MGASWSRDGVIIFGSATTGLFRVSQSGGVAIPVTKLDNAAGRARAFAGRGFCRMAGIFSIISREYPSQRRRGFSWVLWTARCESAC